MIKLYETDRFYLRPFCKEDITDQYLSWFANQEVTKHTSHGLFKYTKEMAIDFLENADRNGDVIWCIMVPTNSSDLLNPSKKIDVESLSPYHGKLYKHIGNIALQNINWINRNAEFAGIIGQKEYWGEGIGTQAIKMLFDHGFNKLNLRKIYLGTAATNYGMIKIASKLRMRKEGELIQHVYLNNKYENVIQFGLLKEDWQLFP